MMIGYLAMAGVVILVGGVCVARLLVLLNEMFDEMRAERKARQFARFENSLTTADADPALVDKVFAGEVCLEQLVYVIFPEELDLAEVESRYRNPSPNATT